MKLRNLLRRGISLLLSGTLLFGSAPASALSPAETSSSQMAKVSGTWTLDLWHYSGGYWKVGNKGSEQIRIEDSQIRALDQYLQANQKAVFTVNVPAEVAALLSEGTRGTDWQVAFTDYRGRDCSMLFAESSPAEVTLKSGSQIEFSATPVFHFNDSGAIDLYSKSGKQMELRKYLWYPTREQQENEGAGCDEYRVGKTVGLGGIALWDKDHEVKLAAERRTARVGKFRGGAFAEMISYGVPYAGRKVDISVRIEMSDNSRKAKIIASVVSGGRVQFVTGLNYHAGEYVQAGWGAIGTWGIHPADVSENPIEVGAGLEYDPDDYVGIPESLDDMVRLVSKPCRKLVTTVVAASVKEDELNTPEKFFDYLF